MYKRVVAFKNDKSTQQLASSTLFLIDSMFSNPGSGKWKRTKSGAWVDLFVISAI
jgi:hypothetical protein